jgi:hypothetical protein
MASFFIQKIVCKKLAALHATGRKGMQSLHAFGGQSHIICIRVAASRMQIVPVWPPFAFNMNKINRNLHATAAMGVQFACDWWPLVTKQETSRQEVCKRPSLHHNYIF